MKNISLAFCLCILLGVFSINIAFAQVGIGTTSPKPEAILDVESTQKGVLFPRAPIDNLHTLDPIDTPTAEAGLLLYNTSNITPKGYYYWNGIDAWISVGGSPGLQFFSYNLSTEGVPDLDDIMFEQIPTKSGHYSGSLNVDFSSSILKPSNDDHFAVKLVGYYNVKHEGVFNFTVTSDDGSRIYIDDVLVLDHWVLSANDSNEGSIRLSKGKHKFEFWYFENTGAESFNFQWGSNPDGMQGSMNAIQFTID